MLLYKKLWIFVAHQTIGNIRIVKILRLVKSIFVQDATVRRSTVHSYSFMHHVIQIEGIHLHIRRNLG